MDAGARLLLLQLRMSKKVAQLTKVIYHLNSKNEDHDLDMQDLAEQYEAELEQTLKDATEKINFFKARMEEASDEKRVREVARVSGKPTWFATGRDCSPTKILGAL